MAKPTKPAAFLVQMLGIMFLVGAVALVIGDSPAIRIGIVSGIIGVALFVWGGRAAR